MTRPLPLAALLLAACSSTTIVYVVDPDAAPAPDAADAAPVADTGAPDTWTPPEDTAPAPDTAPPPDTYDPDAGPHVKCRLPNSVVYEGCNGHYSVRIFYVSSDGKSGDCWPKSEDAGSPPANCVPDTPTISGYCIVTLGATTVQGECI